MSDAPAAPRANRLDWVDTGRGIAICLVALYHSASWLTGGGMEVETWRSVNDAVSSLRMPLFFLLSGLFARKWLHVAWPVLFSGKIKLLAWVFFVWSTIGSTVIALTLIVKGHPEATPASIRLYLLSPISPRFELWFLWALILFFVVAKLIRKVDPRLQLVVTGALSAVALALWISQTTGWTGSAKYFFFFLAGVHLRDQVLRFSGWQNRWVLVLLGVSWAAVSALLTVTDTRGVFPLYFLNCLLGVGAGICLSRLLVKVRWLRTIGSNTLPIYVAHTPTIIIVVTTLEMTGAIPVLQHVAWLAPPVLAVLAVTVAVLLHRWTARGPLRFLYEVPAFAALRHARSGRDRDA